MSLLMFQALIITTIRIEGCHISPGDGHRIGWIIDLRELIEKRQEVWIVMRRRRAVHVQSNILLHDVAGLIRIS